MQPYIPLRFLSLYSQGIACFIFTWILEMSEMIILKQLPLLLELTMQNSSKNIVILLCLSWMWSLKEETIYLSHIIYSQNLTISNYLNVWINRNSCPFLAAISISAISLITWNLAHYLISTQKFSVKLCHGHNVHKIYQGKIKGGRQVNLVAAKVYGSGTLRFVFSFVSLVCPHTKVDIWYLLSDRFSHTM